MAIGKAVRRAAVMIAVLGIAAAQAQAQPSGADSHGAEPVWSGSYWYATSELTNLPVCLSADNYDEGLQMARVWVPDMLARTGCVVPEGGVRMRVVAPVGPHLYQMEMETPSGHRLLVYAPLAILDIPGHP